MPIQVDVTQRRADIAEATFRVAARQGMAPVEIWGYGADGPHDPGGWMEGDTLVLCPGPGHRVW